VSGDPSTSVRGASRPAAIGDRAPLARRGERHLGDEARGIRRRAHPLANGQQRLVGDGDHGRVGGERRRHRGLVVSAQRLDALDHQPVLRERAGLVRAEHVEVAHAFDRAEALHERAVATDADGGGGQRDGDREHEPGRHEAGDDDQREAERVDQVHAGVGRGYHLQRGDHHHERDQALDDEVEVALQRRQQRAGGARGGGDAVGVARGADALGAHEAGAGQAERAAVDRIPGLLDDGVGLAREQRLVHLERVALDQRPVDRRPIARGQLHEIVADDLIHVDLDAGAVASHAGAAGGLARRCDRARVWLAALARCRPRY
jgi:hypothetical protein